MAERMPHMLRIDARDNRDRVLAAAKTLFADRGDEVTMREVARAAGVGPATLYRHFPTKRALMAEAFADEMRQCAAAVTDGYADADPWRGLCTAIERLTLLSIRNQGFVDAFSSTDGEQDAIAQHRASLLRMLADLARRAKSEGALREDFVIDDLVLILQAVRGMAASAPPTIAGDTRVRDTTARRFAALAIDAFRTSATHDRLPPAPRLAHAAVG